MYVNIIVGIVIFMKNFFLLIKLIFLVFLLSASILVISLWNIQSDLPNSNISDYFPNEITQIYLIIFQMK